MHFHKLLSRYGGPLVLLLAVATGPIGCRLSAGEECSVDSDCRSGLVCNLYSLQCSTPELVCETSSDCGDPARPICGAQNECVAGDTSGAAPDVGGPPDLRQPDVVLVVPDITVLADVAERPCPEPPATMLRAEVFEIGIDGHAGSGLDVDGNADTCAPSVACSAGVDNALAVIGVVANATLKAAVDALELSVLFAPDPARPETCPFVFVSRDGEVSGAGDGAFAVLPGGETPPCAAGATFVDACLVGDVLTAGFAAEAVFPLSLPLLGVVLEIPVRDARVHGNVTRNGDGSLASFDGLIAGVVVFAELDAAIALIPTEELPSGMDVGSFVHGLVTADIDTDEDGVPDALSVGIHIRAASVPVTGFAGGQ